jgi:hypothetical protein
VTLFFRIFQHLLPRAEAWKVTTEKTLRKFFLGLAGSLGDAREFVDDVYEDLQPTTTRELAEWEWQFNLDALGDEEDRRLSLDAEWKATGGQSPNYIQQLLWSKGFTNLYVHEWWSSGPPTFVPRDPRFYTKEPRIGEYQCDGEQSTDQPQCAPRLTDTGDPLDQPQCSAFLVNDPGYLVNETLNRAAPPPIPDDPDKWPFFVYVCAEDFGKPGEIDMARLPELKKLLLKVRPLQHWIVLMVRAAGPEPEYFNFNIGNGFDVTVWYPYGD